MKNYQMPDTAILNQIGVAEKITHEFAFAHKVEDKYGILKHYCAMVYPDNYIVNEAQKQFAQKEYNRMKKEKLATIANKLVFVGRGSSYAERYEDDVCNHRISTNIRNPQGRNFYIEVGPNAQGNKMHFSYVIDLDMQREYEEKRHEYYEKIKSMGGFSKVSQNDPVMIAYEKYGNQPYYWYKKDEWYSLKIDYTKSNLIAVVNSLFDCHFTEMEVSEYLIRDEDYASISPKKK